MLLNLAIVTLLKGYKMEAKYKLDAIHVYNTYKAFGIVEAEKELNHRANVRNLKLWEKVALQNEIKKLMRGV